MLLGLAMLAGCPDQSVPYTPSWHYTVVTYEEPRPLAQTFADLAAFIQEHHPDLIADLNPPATDEQLDTLETLIGQRLPEDFRQLYRLANGQDGLETPLFPNGYQFMTLDEIGSEWTAMKRISSNPMLFWEDDTPQGAVKNRS